MTRNIDNQHGSQGGRSIITSSTDYSKIDNFRSYIDSVLSSKYSKKKSVQNQPQLVNGKTKLLSNKISKDDETIECQ